MDILHCYIYIVLDLSKSMPSRLIYVNICFSICVCALILEDKGKENARVCLKLCKLVLEYLDLRLLIASHG